MGFWKKLLEEKRNQKRNQKRDLEEKPDDTGLTISEQEALRSLKKNGNWGGFYLSTYTSLRDKGMIDGNPMEITEQGEQWLKDHTRQN